MDSCFYNRGVIIRRACWIALFCLGLVPWLLLKPTAVLATVSWPSTISPTLRQTAVAALPQTPLQFLVLLQPEADLMDTASIPDKTARGTAIYQRATAIAQASQADLLADLRVANVPYRPFWIKNMVWVEAPPATLVTLAQRADVAAVISNSAMLLDTLPPEPALFGPKTAVFAPNPTWNLHQINAPAVWDLGYTGQGVVIGGQDTGYDWTHLALKEQYRGWNGGTAVHDYHWHDAITSGGNGRCPANMTEPCDDYSSSHGTHTMGIMAGIDGVGVAPGAEWIGCRNMDNGVGTPATYSACYEWFVAPYPLGGDPMTDGDPARAPHVINNSWSCPPSEGCADLTVLQDVVQTVRAAGIVTVHAAGNSGPACGSVNTPAGLYPESFTVGNVQSGGVIAPSSARGPASIMSNSWLKPNLVAPGTAIYSTVRNNGYASLTGTSMAAPHVAGVVALLISADPTLAGDVGQIEAILQQTAVSRTSAQGCGGDSATAVPNHVYGYGQVDALQAVLSRFPQKSYLPLTTGD